MDAVVVGSGPNGLAAAITLARAGRSVVVLEAASEPGGGCRSAELTEPGFVHDVGSAIHPLAKASPFFSELDLERFGLEWVSSPAAVGQAIDGDRVSMAWCDLERTAEGLGVDGDRYRAIFGPLVERIADVVNLSLGPPLRWPPRPRLAARFGLEAARPATGFIDRFRTEEARALFMGHAAHSTLRLDQPFTSGFGILLTVLAHGVGWPFPRGGAQSLTSALVDLLIELGAEVRLDHRVSRLEDLPPSEIVVFALTPSQVLDIVGDRFPARYRRRLQRFRYGPGAYKIDFALSEPVPWSNPVLADAATVHVGGTARQMVRAEGAVARGHHPREPFVLFAQPSLFDSSRAPDGRHTGWAYCHVPHGSTVDMSKAIVDQIERFAPGFRDTVLAQRVSTPADLEAGNANLVGGDIAGGSMAGPQLLLRPRPQTNPYRTGDPKLFIGSASASPGAGAHGMSGHLAALTAMRQLG